MSRRALIRRTGVAAAIGWTAPLIIESLASPAGAVSAAPGCYWIAWQQNVANVANSFTTPATTNFCTPANCTAPAAIPANATAASVGLSATGGPINHVAAGKGNGNAVTFTIAGGYSCRIVGLVAVEDQVGTGQYGGCYQPVPSPPAAQPNMTITAGAFNTKTITVDPTDVAFAAGVTTAHWGANGTAPNGTPPTSPTGAVTNGYIVVTVQCP